MHENLLVLKKTAFDGICLEWNCKLIINPSKVHTGKNDDDLELRKRMLIKDENEID